MALSDITDRVSGLLQGIRGEWNLLDEEEGETVAAFTSFVSFSITGKAGVTSYAVESGSFTSAGKTAGPETITLVLAVAGSREEMRETGEKLREYKDSPKKVTVITPYGAYAGHTVTGCSYSHKSGNGAGVLTVELTLQEVKEKILFSGTAAVTDPENAATLGRGKIQPEEITASDGGLYARSEDAAGSYRNDYAV